MSRNQGKLTVNKKIKDTPTAYAELFESARWLSRKPQEAPKSASQLFNEMVKSYYINEMGYTEDRFQRNVQACIDMGMSEDGTSLNPDPEVYP